MPFHLFFRVLAYCLIILSTFNVLASSKANSLTETNAEHAVANIIQQTLIHANAPFNGNVLLLEHGEPKLELQLGQGLQQDSSFVIASLSKQITATLIMRAVEEGKLDLNQSLNNYLFNDKNAQAQNSSNLKRYDSRINLHHLLSNTSGVAPLGKPNRFEPGHKFEYSNLGYSLLGKVLESAYQRPFAELIKSFASQHEIGQLYAKTGSINSIQLNLPSLAKGLDEHEVIKPTTLILDKALLPSGGLIASTHAFASFQYKLHSGQLVQRESYQKMITPHAPFQFFWSGMSYGYGLRINNEQGLKEYSHTGYLPGYMSMSLHYPEFGIDLVMLENLSLNIDDIDRVFEVHSKVRDAIRKQLLSSKTHSPKEELTRSSVITTG